MVNVFNHIVIRNYYVGDKKKPVCIVGKYWLVDDSIISLLENETREKINKLAHYLNQKEIEELEFDLYSERYKTLRGSAYLVFRTHDCSTIHDETANLHMGIIHSETT